MNVRLLPIDIGAWARLLQVQLDARPHMVGAAASPRLIKQSLLDSDAQRR
jgi:hypothetical protein